MKKLPALITAGAIVLIVAVAGVAYLNHELGRNISVADEGRLFRIERGASLKAVISRLVNEGIIVSNSWVTGVYALVSVADGTIKAGEYRLLPDMSTRDVLALFRSGRVVQRQITFVEGWSFREWRSHLEDYEGVSQTLDGNPDSAIMELLGEHDAVVPEGQFFPDTYHFTAGESDLSILKRAHERMQEVLDEEWRSRSVGNPLETPYQALILASIVEKETGYEPDRTRIARVFINRLQRNIRLQSDPTVIYGLGERFDGDLTRQDLKDASPYNTYQYRGLPPTPISNPGLASLRAAMQPEAGDWLYFVGRGDGTSYFSSTLAEHNEAVTRFQKTGRVENYRSVPEGR